MCIYGNNALLTQVTAPPGMLWHPLRGTPPNGYRYADRKGINSGITRAKVSAGVAGRTVASVAGRGVNLPTISLPLAAGQLPVTVQLVNNNTTPQCWTANYTNPPARNQSNRFQVTLP